MVAARSGPGGVVVIWKRSGVPALLVTGVLSLILLFSGDAAQLRVARTVEGVLLEPLFRTLGLLRGGVTAFGSHHALAERAAELEKDRDLFVERGLENMRLRRLLGFQAQAGFDLIPAEVLRHDASRLGETIVVSVTPSQGAAAGQAVIAPEGLVGRVTEVHAAFAYVQLLRSPTNPVSVRVQRSRVVGTLRWDPARPSTFDLLYVPAHADCEVGDVVVSSGLGGAYPAGIRAGVVASVGRDLTGLMMDVRVEPAVDFSRLEEVFLLRPRPGETDFGRMYEPRASAAADTARR
jgi:rod shape-determining protein MreC